MADDEQQQFDVVKWFTAARNVRPVMGYTPHGGKIPLGPFDTYGAVGAIALFVVGYGYFDLGMDSGAGPWLVLVAATIGTYLLIARMPTDGRNPLMVAGGYFSYITAASTGVLNGRALHLPRPHLVTGHTLISIDPQPQDTSEPAAKTQPPTATAAAVSRPDPGRLTTDHRPPSEAQQPNPAPRTISTLSGVQRLLASLPDDHQ